MHSSVTSCPQQWLSLRSILLYPACPVNSRKNPQNHLESPKDGTRTCMSLPLLAGSILLWYGSRSLSAHIHVASKTEIWNANKKQTSSNTGPASLPTPKCEVILIYAPSLCPETNHPPSHPTGSFTLEYGAAEPGCGRKWVL